MIGHVFKLVWNRKGTNLLIVAEIFCSFLVVFAVAATALYGLKIYGKPLGFEWRDVWQVEITRTTSEEFNDWSSEDAELSERLNRAVEALGPVRAVAGATTAPYMGSVNTSIWNQGGRDVQAEVSVVTPELLDVLGLEIVSGRWFGPEDDGLGYAPVVIDKDLARELVGDGDPLGVRIGSGADGDPRVVGVIRNYRRGGELEEDVPYLIWRSGKQGSEPLRQLEVMLVRLAPGTPAEFEEPLLETLQSIGREWSFTVTHLEAARRSHLKSRLIPLSAIGVVAGFLLLMVALGLIGVMWQNVTRRTREFGLRRAAGAHRARIHRQIVAEVSITAGLALAVGSLVAIQVPLIGPFTFVPWPVILTALALSAALILSLAAICGLYPGWTATRIAPAEALHYE